MKRVDILYKSLPSYRIEFFERLRRALADDDVELRLTYGDPGRTEKSKKDARTLEWATKIPNRFVDVGSTQLIWQPVSRQLRGSDLIIAEQASKLLVNYPLLGRSVLRLGTPFAFWGHGANLQTHRANPLSEAIKRRYSRLPHWWFAYTEDSKARVTALGFPQDRITVVQNAIDTAGLRAGIQGVTQEEVVDFLAPMGAVSGRVATFLGSLYDDKRLDFLVEAAVAAREHDHQFTLLIAGDGPDRDMVDEAARQHDFIYSLGRVDGARRNILLAATDVMVMPGLVGLAALDAFGADAPMVTISHNFHSPEVAYLEHNSNSLVLEQETSPSQYGARVVQLLQSPDELATLRQGCAAAAQIYTVEAMVANFRNGVLGALGSAR